MKKLTIVLFVLIAFGLVFAFSTGLYAEKKEEAKKEEMKKCTEGTFYYCPMKECDYKSDKPGKCPTCSMELKKHEHKTVYVCPMKQCNVETDKPGKCPKCGMTLKEKEVCNFEMDKKGEEHKKEHEGETHDHKH